MSAIGKMRIYFAIKKNRSICKDELKSIYDSENNQEPELGTILDSLKAEDLIIESQNGWLVAVR